MARRAVDNFVHYDGRDAGMPAYLTTMSTMDLALCLVLLTRELRAAHAERDRVSAQKCGDRIGMVERELERRQLRLDELLGAD
jgi:hypothetical protein